MPAVARQNGIAGVCMHSPFGCAHDAGDVGESDRHLTFQLSRFHALRVVGDIRRKTVLPTAAKYQMVLRIHSAPPARDKTMVT
jgi:hypothetical protein